MKIDDWILLCKRISAGTSPKIFWSIGTVLLAVAGALFIIPDKSVSLPISPNDLASTTKPTVPQQKSLALSPESVTESAKLNSEAIDKLQSEINRLKSDNSRLQTEIETKSQQRCQQYDAEIKYLRGKKNEADSYIQALLHPVPTQQMQQENLIYSAENLEHFRKLAVEYRKTADDLLKQIELLENTRKRCN